MFARPITMNVVDPAARSNATSMSLERRRGWIYRANVVVYSKRERAAPAWRWASDKRAMDGERAARGRTAPSPRRAAYRHAWQAPLLPLKALQRPAGYSRERSPFGAR
jgi:hypothetical protein